MRTTLDIDADILQAAKELAALKKSTAGKVLSDLAKRGLKQPARPGRRDKVRNGIRMLPVRDEIITNAHVDKLRQEEGI
ncbi:MAG: hypothetical protein H8E20_16020 [Verrucomicrobia bacterium]|nr:hypothetical protein [Verrucomicrobiota bacterium]